MQTTIFIGSGSFAVPILRELAKADFIQLVAIITQPDRPAGRKQKLHASEVKAFAQEQNLNVPILTPEKLREDASNILDDYKPELIIVADYGQIIPDVMLDAPVYKCLNVHGSLLPHLRGAVPIPMAILQGMTTTGITIPVMTPGLDDGPIVARVETNILPDDTTKTLKERLAELGAKELVRVLPEWIEGKISAWEQDNAKATICYQKDIAKDKAEIAFDTDIELAERMIRALDPWPIAWTKVEANIVNESIDETLRTAQSKRLKIYQAKIADKSKSDSAKLEIVRIGKQLFLQLQNGRLELLELQLEGKQRLPVHEYLYLGLRDSEINSE